MLLGTIRRPHFVLECAALALLVQERAAAVGAGPELARRLEMSELAAGYLALTTVATRGHCRMPEGAERVGAIGPVLAVLLALMGRLGRW
jgi:hypothetical protein